MASVLYRLGRFTFRRRRLVLAVWLAVLVALGTAASTLSGQFSNEFSIPGTESQEALDLLEERFPEAGLELGSANVVLAAPPGERVDDPQFREAAAEVLEEVRGLEGVVNVTDPFASQAVSPDGRVARATATYDVEPLEVTPEDREALFETAEAGRDAGLQVEFSGTAAIESEPPAGATELIGVAVAALVLLGTFGSVVAAGLPLLVAFLAVGIGVAGITALTGFLELSETAPVLALMLGLAVGIDYALFVTSRYRHELIAGRDGEEAAGRAVATAGSAVVFAGLTVVIALVGLFTVNIPFLTIMGLAAAGTVAVAVLVALTVLPAVLGFAGSKVLGRKGRAAADVEGDLAPGQKPPAGERWARFVVRHKVPVLLATVAALGVVAIPTASLETALPDEGQLSEEMTQRKAYDLITQSFGPGANGPLIVVADTREASDPPAALQTVAAELQAVDGVVAVTPPMPNGAGDTHLLTVIPASGPADSRTQQVVDALRARAPDLEGRTGAQLSVTGATALTVDVDERLSEALPIYLLVVVGLALVLLTIVFRSVLVPLKAVLGFLLTVLATFGAVVAIFQWGWLSDVFGVDQPAPILTILPIFMIGIIFGLAMDYEVFLVTRIREEHVHGEAADDAIILGFRHGARVVTAAALIMISVFAAFMLAPDPITRSLGFAFAFGIAVDAFVVRMTLVPAVLALLGERAWWLPRWLDRVVPDVDVEGSTLRVEDEAPRPEASRV
ncbi:MAG TPA: MMPL family transporter [Mycobacteriales bacterium]|nr:MMPL family transporter [Mycobacteriales bacterium]